ncbi:Rieske 2Fe-2S domain-containing protein [bacterium]|nr:Rieske 2Fe-2S domain-containing protein [bacterium]
MRELPPIDADIRRAATPPGHLYHDPAIHAAALERVFAPSWQLVPADAPVPAAVGHAAPLTLLPGSLDEPLLLRRDEAGDLGCVSNVCTHRGMLLQREPGPCSQLRCGYHGRSFAPDGTLTHMPGFEDAHDFPGPDDHLRRPGLFRLGPLTFLQVVPGVPAAAVLGPLQAAMAWYPWGDLRFAPDRSRDYEVAANWALYCENYLEGFHIPWVHPELNRRLDWRAYEVHLHARATLQVGMGVAGDPVFDLPAGHPDHGRPVAAWYWWVYPNLMLNFYPWGLSVNIVEPLGPTRCRVRFQSHVARPDLLDRGAGGPLDAVEMEDEAVVEAVQRGVRSRLYHRGRYAPRHEIGTHHFHRLLVADLTA